MDARLQWRVPDHRIRAYKAASDRWARFGPYYAMFPVAFARQVIAEYTQPGDLILDPFCGRGTSIFCAAEAGREGYGIEINPVGWLYSRVKLKPAKKRDVEARLEHIARLARRPSKSVNRLPKFFHKCFSSEVLSFLLACKRNLKWKTNSVDATLMAFVILHLHGRIDEQGRPQALSNQMRQTKSMSPPYSMRWWKKHGYNSPPKLDPEEFLRARIEWRYKKGKPYFPDSFVKLGDARRQLLKVPKKFKGKFQLLLTSPPYSAVTSYYFDQWLRLWMLGGPAIPSRTGEKWKGRFENREEYSELLEATFKRCSNLMSKDAVIYVRTDARRYTRKTTLIALKKAFPNRVPLIRPRPFKVDTQTALFGDAEKKPGEVDIILLP